VRGFFIWRPLLQQKYASAGKSIGESLVKLLKIELHLDAGQFDDVMIIQLVRCSPTEEHSPTGSCRFNVSDAIAVRTTCQHGNLFFYSWLSQGGRFLLSSNPAQIRAVQYLDHRGWAPVLLPVLA